MAPTKTTIGSPIHRDPVKAHLYARESALLARIRQDDNAPPTLIEELNNVRIAIEDILFYEHHA